MTTKMITCILLVTCTYAFPAQSQKSKSVKGDHVTIGFIQEGKWARLEAIGNAFRREIRRLTDGEFDVRFPDEKYLVADFSRPGILKAIDRLMSDPEVDMIIGLGPLVSHELCRGAIPSKPVIAPFVLSPEVQKLPLEGDVSGVSTLSYISYPANALRDIEVFRTIVPFTRLTVLLGHTVSSGIPELHQAFQEALTAMGIEATHIEVGESAMEALQAIPPRTEAVYVAPIFYMSEAEFSELAAGLKKMGLPSFSMLGVSEVEQGVLGTVGPSSMVTRLARRVGLYVQRILLDEEPGELSVRFERREKLTLNMETARAINLYPSWDVLRDADLLYPEPVSPGEIYWLEKVAREAVAANLDLRASDREVAAGEENLGIARSVLLPQIDVSALGTVIDRDRAESSLGTQPQRRVTGSATLSQLIYSEPAWANLAIQGHIQDSRVQDRESLRLDIIQEAVTAYLNVLRSKTLHRIQRENLTVTQSNLDLSRARVSIGAAGRQEVLRWESEIAGAKIEVLQADALRKQATIALNRILNRPLEQRFTTTEADLSDSTLLTSDERLFRYTGNPLLFEVFRDFMVQQGMHSSPELKAIDAATAAQDRILTSAHNAFWAPAVALQGDATYTFHRSGAGTEGSVPGFPFQAVTPDDLNWAVALQLSLPIFTSGERFAQVAQARETVEQLRTERAAVTQRIELAIRFSLQTTSASYGSIRLSREGADAALENLELVTDAYSRGALDIIQLLDAQNSARNATLAAENAVYDFLIDFMNVQRSIGSFDIFMSPEEKEEWFEQLGDYYRKRGIIPRNP